MRLAFGLCELRDSFVSELNARGEAFVVRDTVFAFFVGGELTLTACGSGDGTAFEGGAAEGVAATVAGFGIILVGGVGTWTGCSIHSGSATFLVAVSADEGLDEGS